MKTAIRSFWWLAVVAMMGLAPCSFAQDQDGIQVDLTGTGIGYVYDSVYVSPYTATVNGAPNTQVICDDFSDESYLGQPWSANTTMLSGLSSDSELGRTMWGSYYLSKGVADTTIVGWYEQAASLSLGLLQQTQGSASQAYYSYAIWAVFDPGDVLKWLQTHGAGGGADVAACNAIFGSGNNCGSTTVTNGLLSLSYNKNLSAYANFLIISPLGANGLVCTPGMGGGTGSNSCPAQEFFQLVPEGGTALMYLMLAGVSCFGAMFFRSRSQRVNPRTA